VKNIIKIDSSEIDCYFQKIKKDYVNYFFGIKSLAIILIQFILAFSLVLPLFTDDNYLKIIKYTDGVEQVAYKKYYLFVIIGFIVLLYSIYGLYKNQKDKSAAEKLFSDKLDELKEVNSEIEYRLKEEELEFSSKVQNWSKNWNSLNYYKTDNQFLKIYSLDYHKSYPEIIIPLKFIEENQLVWLEKRLAKK
jgi:hypothetical protein